MKQYLREDLNEDQMVLKFKQTDPDPGCKISEGNVNLNFHLMRDKFIVD
jgi:hypothetical protein